MDSLDEKLVEKFLSGACSRTEIAQILEWFNASEENRKEWLNLRMILARGNFAYFSDPEHIEHSYREICKEQAIRERLEREITRKISLRFMRYAACILLLIGLSYGSYKYFADWQYPKTIEFAVAATEPIQQILLHDSTRVWLSANSRIEYPEKFRKKERHVTVEGKVYFEVAKDTQRPFIVKTETYMVKVLGTSFEVNSFKYRQTSDVILVEGSVEILDNKMNLLYMLQPGQQFEMDKLNNQFTLHEVDAAPYTGWHSGQLEFDGMTFAEIARVLERQYDVRIVLDKDIAGETQLVGSLSFKKDIHEMMKTIELVVPIKYKVETDTIVYIESK